MVHSGSSLAVYNDKVYTEWECERICRGYQGCILAGLRDGECLVKDSYGEVIQGNANHSSWHKYCVGENKEALIV